MINWEDLRLFLAVARSGGLAAAKGSAQASPPTLGRRMMALEAALGVALFERRRDGYELTKAGRELLDRAETLEEGALAVERWRTARNPQPTVRIAVGAWTGTFIARHLAALVEPEGGQQIELLIGAGLADLTRREANLGIRNRRPDIAGLAGRRLGRVAFAAYGAPSYIAAHPQAADDRRFGACDWLAYAPPEAAVPSAIWLAQRLERPARFTCSDPQPLLQAAIGGAGLCLVPCFIGDAEARLQRASLPISELGHDQWLVSHDDDRHSSPIRQVAERLARLFRSHKPLFAGKTKENASA